MKERTLTAPQEPANTGCSRRYFLSLPVVAGGILLLNETAAGSPAGQKRITAEEVQENISSADSVVLYANLLPAIRNSAFDKKLHEIGLLKELASGRLQDLIKSADALGAKYPMAATADKDQLFADFKLLIRRFKDTEGIKEILERSRNELPELARIDAKIKSVNESLLQASASLNRLKGESFSIYRIEAINHVSDAIGVLLELLGREVIENELDSPTERLIVLLRGVQVGIERENRLPTRWEITKPKRRHHAAMPASSIMGVLRKHVSPGYFWQLGIGYGVAFPVLLRNSDRTIREKLLMDGLRLVPGLVASALGNAAKELANVSL